MKYFPLFILLFCAQTLCAQIEISEPAEIKNLIEAWENQNFKVPYQPGWRVQIGASNDLKKADDLKAKFADQFPGVVVDWVQEYPYYKVRAGAFLTKKDAKNLIVRLGSLYPGAHAAKDEEIPVNEF